MSAVTPSELEWRERGLCWNRSGDLWFSEEYEDQLTAVKICHECPVEPLCLWYAMRTKQPAGVWGGATERQREWLKRRRSRHNAQRQDQ